ncbi:MAG: NAD(P)H-binding protein [Granulosicoccus sp.]
MQLSESSFLPSDTLAEPSDKRRVLVLGASGTAGKATTLALFKAGHQVSCLVRAGRDGGISENNGDRRKERSTDNVLKIRRSIELPEEIEILIGDVTDPSLLQQHIFLNKRFDVLVSCLTSRTGVPADAWAIDHDAHVSALKAAKAGGVQHIVLLSAICVQKPLLAFQHAKLAFEKQLIDSGLTYSIVRPTAFFKSLSGQVERVRKGKPFLLFGDGRLTACKPISDNDLGNFMAACLIDSSKFNKILPIGGPGDAITLREQGEHLFALTGQTPRFRQVPIGLLDGIQFVLKQLGRVNKSCAEKAELARIGRYYATESMLVLNPETGRYDADMTPSTGTETLYEFYAALLDGSASVERGEHAVFTKPSK